jgi:23S rRNA pseudouridine2605 synthase
MRLQVFLARGGIASRRACEKLILEGRVAINGLSVNELGIKVAPSDIVTLDGRTISPEKTMHYIVLNKPPRFICTQKDPQNRPLARDLLPAVIRERLYNVGRLDFLSSGLIFFTNDGQFARRLSHPSSRIEKEYFVESANPIPPALAEQFEAGITIEGERYKANYIELLGWKTLKIVLTEGKNREIRRVFSHFNIHPVTIRRIRIGPVLLGNLPEGRARPLTEDELRRLSALRE